MEEKKKLNPLNMLGGLGANADLVSGIGKIVNSGELDNIMTMGKDTLGHAQNFFNAYFGFKFNESEYKGDRLEVLERLQNIENTVNMTNAIVIKIAEENKIDIENIEYKKADEPVTF